MGGLTTTAVTYLLTERIMRPLTARALAAESPPRLCGPGVQGRLLLAWLLATGVPLLGMGFVGLHAAIEGPSERVATSVLVLSGAALSIGLVATVLVARSVGEPRLALRSAIGRIEAGELDVEVSVNDGSEVGLSRAASTAWPSASRSVSGSRPVRSPRGDRRRPSGPRPPGVSRRRATRGRRAVR